MSWTAAKIKQAKAYLQRKWPLTEIAGEIGEPFEEVSLLLYGNWLPVLEPVAADAPVEPWPADDRVEVAERPSLLFTIAGRLPLEEARARFPDRDVVAESEELADEFGDWLAMKYGVTELIGMAPRFVEAEVVDLAPYESVDVVAPDQPIEIATSENPERSEQTPADPPRSEAAPRKDAEATAPGPIHEPDAAATRRRTPIAEQLFHLVNAYGEYLDKSGIGFTTKPEKAWRGDQSRVDTVKSMKTAYRDLTQEPAK